MSGSRRSLVIGAAVTAALAVLSFFSALVTNAASSATQWPGWLDYLRRHPWITLAVLVGITIALSVVAAIAGGSGSTPLSNEELLATEDRLRQHVDNAESRRMSAGDSTEGMPPYPRAHLDAAGQAREEIWRVVSPFFNETNDPLSLAREWSISLPPAVGNLPVSGRIVVAELLLCYGQPEAARRQMRNAVDLGASPRAFWLIRMARISAKSQQELTVDQLLNEAERVDPNYPPVVAMRAVEANQWEDVLSALDSWEPTTLWEREVLVSFRCAALSGTGKLDELISLLAESVDEIQSTPLMIQLSQHLRMRAVRGTGDSRLADAASAVEFAIRARNLRRLWRTDSSEAVAVAAEAAVITEDGQRVWDD